MARSLFRIINEYEHQKKSKVGKGQQCELLSLLPFIEVDNYKGGEETPHISTQGPWQRQQYDNNDQHCFVLICNFNKITIIQ